MYHQGVGGGAGVGPGNASIALIAAAATCDTDGVIRTCAADGDGGRR